MPHEQKSRAIGEESLIDSVCGVVEKAWKSGSQPDLRQCLPAGCESMHRDMLLQMILVDSCYRKKQGLTATLENYLETFPELRPLETLPKEFVAQVRSVDAGSGLKRWPGMREQANDDRIAVNIALEQTAVGNSTGDNASIVKSKLPRSWNIPISSPPTMPTKPTERISS